PAAKWIAWGPVRSSAKMLVNVMSVASISTVAALSRRSKTDCDGTVSRASRLDLSGVMWAFGACFSDGHDYIRTASDREGQGGPSGHASQALARSQRYWQ